MGNEPGFNGKWDFRRKEHGFDDSSSDDPDSKSTQDPIIQNPNFVLDSDQIDIGTRIVTSEQPAKTRKRKSKKNENKPEKAKQVRRRKPKAVPAEETKNKEETVTGMDGIGIFMETLLNDLTASRETLMDWMKNELCGSPDQNVASQPPPKKRAVAAQRSVKKKTKKKEEEEKRESKKQSKPVENGQEMNKPNVNGQEMVHSGGDAGSSDRFLNSGQGGLAGYYFQRQQEGQQALVAQSEQTEMENMKNEAVKSQKSIVLAIKAPTLSERQRKANNKKNRSSMVERTGYETQNDINFVTPYAPKLSSSSSLQSLPQLPSSLLFPSSGQEISSLASKTNFQLSQPVAQMPDLSEYQTGVIEGQGFGNSQFPINGYSNGYFSGYPSAFQPNPYTDSYNFPAPVDPATSSQQRDNNNMFGDLRMPDGAITFSGNRFPEANIGNGGNNGLPDYRTSSGR